MKKVLIIEDNETNLYLLKFLLKQLEVEIIYAENGQDGVELALSDHPDLILMDIQIPIFNGYEATRQIRAQEKGNPIPIIAITSYAMEGDREKCFACGCTHYIEKPINPKEILTLLTQILNNSD